MSERSRSTGDEPEGSGGRYPFHRVTEGQVIQSVCLRCMRTVAYSPRPEVLLLAEEAHRCLMPPASTVRIKLV